MRIGYPEKLLPLLDPARFKSIRGGRDGGKSWGVSMALLQMGASQKHFMVCARETMQSMRDSVHRTLRQQIDRMDMLDQYEVQQSLIRHRWTGTEFVFTGLQNPDALKSLEGATIAWVEEAQSVSDESWRKLIPTVRRPNSEIWLTWNPELESDPTWKRFVISPPPGLTEISMNFADNPWASEVLAPEREQMRRDDPDEYAHVWLGQPRRMTKGSIYGVQLRLAEEQGRIAKIEHKGTLTVDCGFDLGDGDFTAIWFIQSVMGQHRVIDYEEDRHKPLSHYLTLLEGKGYKYGRIFFPWDAASKIVVGSLEETMRRKGFNVTVLPRQSREAGIDAVREDLGSCWWDSEKCEHGLNRLRYYRYEMTTKVDPVTGDPSMAREPAHDENSHGADAIRTWSMGRRWAPNKKIQPRRPQQRGGQAMSPWT